PLFPREQIGLTGENSPLDPCIYSRYESGSPTRSRGDTTRHPWARNVASSGSESAIDRHSSIGIGTRRGRSITALKASAFLAEDRCVSAELVEEEVHVRGDLLDVLAGEADVGRGAGVQQRGAITQLEALDQPPEGLRVGALRERCRLEVFVHQILPWRSST